MTAFTELLLALLLITDLYLAAASRLRHCIKLAALQGLVIGILPLALWNWEEVPHTRLILIAAATFAVKGILLPVLLDRTMIRARVKRELEPLVGYSLSLLIVLAAAGISFALSSAYHVSLPESPKLALPAAFSTIITGLFIIIARKKAITQAIGFLVFENGITLFGSAMMIEYALIVELGILLDVFVLVFVMGIAVFQISREFSHIDADKLTLLNDSGASAQPEGEK